MTMKHKILQNKNIDALKGLLKNSKIGFETMESCIYNPALIAKIEKSKQEFK